MSPAEEVVERLTVVFGEPKTPSPELFLIEFTRALTGWDGDVLHRAADRVIAKSTFWPRPAEVLGEARIVAADKYRANATPAEHKPFDQRTARTVEQRAAAQELVDNMKRFLADHVQRDGSADQSIDWRRGQRHEFRSMQSSSRFADLHLDGDEKAACRDDET